MILKTISNSNRLSSDRSKLSRCFKLQIHLFKYFYLYGIFTSYRLYCFWGSYEKKVKIIVIKDFAGIGS